jgi:hypothetical protein
MKVADKTSGREAARLDCYFHQGNYAAGLERWLDHFAPEQLLTIKSEDFYLDPAAEYNRTLKFLELPAHDLDQYEVYNAATFTELDPATRHHLADQYQQPNKRFYELVGADLGWT